MSQKSAATTNPTSHKVLDSTQLVSGAPELGRNVGGGEDLLEVCKKLTRNMRKNIKK